jgi:transposase InsO family protein
MAKPRRRQAGEGGISEYMTKAGPRFLIKYTAQRPTRWWPRATRYIRTRLEEWANARLFTSGSQRAAALPGWLQTYNHHRAHTALGGQPPISRITVNDLAGQNS